MASDERCARSTDPKIQEAVFPYDPFFWYRYPHCSTKCNPMSTADINVSQGCRRLGVLMSAPECRVLFQVLCTHHSSHGRHTENIQEEILPSPLPPYSKHPPLLYRPELVTAKPRDGIDVGVAPAPVVGFWTGTEG